MRIFEDRAEYSKAADNEKYEKDLKAFLDIFYADDLTYATTSQQHRQDIKDNTPQKLKNHNLHVNGTKTEEG